MNRRGVGLIDSMIGVAIMAITFLAFSHMAKISGDMGRLRQAKERTHGLKNLVLDSTKYSDLCTQAANNITLNFDPTQPVPNNFSQEISLRIPGIRLGSRFGDPDLISSRAPNNINEKLGLQVVSLRVEDFYEVPGSNVNGVRDYYGVIKMQLGVGPREMDAGNNNIIQLEANTAAGRLWNEQVIGGIIYRVNDITANVESCTGSAGGSISEICTDFGCNYDPNANPPCDCPRDNIGCQAGSLPVAINNGIMECKAWGGRCNNGRYVVAAGLEYVSCADGPPPGNNDCTITAGTNWAVGAFTCTADADVVVADGRTGTATDSVDPETGSANYTCNAGVLTPDAGATCSNIPMGGCDGVWRVRPNAFKPNRPTACVDIGAVANTPCDASIESACSTGNVSDMGTGFVMDVLECMAADPNGPSCPRGLDDCGWEDYFERGERGPDDSWTRHRRYDFPGNGNSLSCFGRQHDFSVTQQDGVEIDIGGEVRDETRAVCVCPQGRDLTGTCNWERHAMEWRRARNFGAPTTAFADQQRDTEPTLACDNATDGTRHFNRWTTGGVNSHGYEIEWRCVCH